jgi:hypothetical protein
MPLRTLAVLALLLVTSIPGTAAARQEPPPIAETKRKLILELIEVMNQRLSSEQLLEAITSELMHVMEQAYASDIRSSSEFTSQEKDRLIKDQRMMADKMIAKFRERFLAEVDFKRLQEELMLGLYDKYFTQDEIRDLTAFYRTPTGQKTLTVLPSLYGESIRRSNELIGEQVSRISREVVQQVLDEARAAKKRPKR